MKKLLMTLTLFVSLSLFAQENTVGLIYGTDQAADGYTLFAPSDATTTYLIDNDGFLINKWESDLTTGQSVYLLETGNLLRTEMVRNQNFSGGGTGGRVKEMTWDGKTVWQFDYSSTSYCQHHDIEYLPNGNILMVAWEYKSASEAIAAGRNSTLLFQNKLHPDHLIEVEPVGENGGNIVWEWHAWDHLVQDHDASKANYGVVADHPELIDLNYTQSGSNGGAADWLHINSVDYNADLDQIALSVHNLSEVWIIDHSTTTEEAAGHTGGRYGKGGDILYRFGNPQAFDHGTSSDRILFVQHHAEWIPEGYPGSGNMTVFNNGSQGTSHSYSSSDEYILPVDENGNYTLIENSTYLAPTLTWTFSAENPSDFFAHNISGTHRLQNGNTLICNGPQGTFFEVTSEKEIVWQYVNPVTRTGILEQGAELVGSPASKNSRVFRCTRYTPDYAAFEGKDLTPGSPIELYPDFVSDVALPLEFSLSNYPNPFNPVTNIKVQLEQRDHVTMTIFNALGQPVTELVNENMNPGTYNLQWDASQFSSGIYFCRISTSQFTKQIKMVLTK